METTEIPLSTTSKSENEILRLGRLVSDNAESVGTQMRIRADLLHSTWHC